MTSVTKTIDWLGIKKIIDKAVICSRLKSLEQDIVLQKANINPKLNCHRVLAARGEVILRNDDYFNQGIRNIIIKWKNDIDHKIKNAEDVNWNKELDEVKNITERLRNGLGLMEDCFYLIILLGLIGIFTSLIAKYICK